MVGMAGFEPTTTSPPARCATRLRYIPNHKHQDNKLDNYNEQKLVNHEDFKENQENEDPDITRRKRRRSSAGNE